MKKTLMIVVMCTFLFSGRAQAEEEIPTLEQSQTETTEMSEETSAEPIHEPETTEMIEQIDVEQKEQTKNQSKEQIKVALPNVNFSDPILKQAILTSLRLPDGSDVTEEDMAKLTSLNLGNADISNLSGLEYAINLAYFTMGTNRVTDFSPIENLSKLEYVSMQSMNLTSQNFPNFSQPEKLIQLDLGNSPVDDSIFDKIVKLTHLTSIRFDSNQKITTIAPLKVLPELKSLRIQFCGVSDFTMIGEFPKLNNLAAFGQNIGRNEAATTLKSTALSYDSVNQSVSIPFSIMSNRLTNFDGYLAPFTTSTSASNTYLAFNDVQLPADRLQIDGNGITVLNVSEEDFENIATLEYNARFDNAEGTYAKPDGYQFYSISAGTYLHTFNIDHTPVQLFQIQYDGNGQTYGEAPVDSTEYLENELATVLEAGDLTKENAHFAGWNTQADGKGIQYNAGDSIQMNGNLTLYAQWTVIPKEDENEVATDNTLLPDADETTVLKIPDQTSQSAEKAVKKQTTTSNKPKKLPETGEQNATSILYNSMGVALVLIGFLKLRKNKLSNK